MYCFIGIDPGETGAMAAIEEERESGYGVLKINLFDFEDGEAILYLKKAVRTIPIVKAVVERTHHMPGQSATAAFKCGYGAAIWHGRLEALKIPFDIVTYSKWTNFIYDSGTKKKGVDLKAIAIDRAKRIFPQMQEEITLKKHHNRAEALLIAEYCRRQYYLLSYNGDVRVVKRVNR